MRISRETKMEKFTTLELTESEIQVVLTALEKLVRDSKKAISSTWSLSTEVPYAKNVLEAARIMAAAIRERLGQEAPKPYIDPYTVNYYKKGDKDGRSA